MSLANKTNKQLIKIFKARKTTDEMKKNIRRILRKRGDTVQNHSGKSKQPTRNRKANKVMKVKNKPDRSKGAYDFRTSVSSQRDSRRKYTVARRRSDKRWTCSCPHWIGHCNSEGIDCKHIKTVKLANKTDGRRKAS